MGDLENTFLEEEKSVYVCVFVLSFVCLCVLQLIWIPKFFKHLCLCVCTYYLFLVCLKNYICVFLFLYMSVCLFCLCFDACFTSDHHNLKSIQGQTCHGCLKDMVKSFCLTWESNLGPFTSKSSTLPLDQSTNSLIIFCFSVFSLFVQSEVNYKVSEQTGEQTNKQAGMYLIHLVQCVWFG